MKDIFSIWAFTLPVSMCLHVIEEFLFPGGFIKWYHSYRPQFAKVKPIHYFKVNAVGIIILFAIAIITSKGVNYGSFILVYGFLSCNAIITHLVGAIKTKRYSPGMVTGLVLYIPLTVISYILAIKAGKLDLDSIILCLALSPVLEIIFAKKPGAGKLQHNL